ncbi:MAG: 5-deoxy-glucuronate isomerase [Phycisphaerales bacterium]|nr:5-deoxy-glucuronate isomerase [Phycisphaerales bacterium]
MQETLRKYRRAIRQGKVNPLVHWDGQTSGLLMDSTSADVPLCMLDFACYRLEDGPFTIKTREREFAFLPVNGQFEVQVDSQVFQGRRDGGPFAGLPGQSNASAVYAPADANVQLSGQGEMICFSAPAAGHKPPAYVQPGQRPNMSRGTGLWLREVVSLFSPEDVSTVLVGGETYSPPGLWSGTPLHVHDQHLIDQGQSDHEEIYYHLARITQGEWGPFGVQMLFDNDGLDQAYVIHDHDAFAIPGGAHPVIAGPNSDMLYMWALAGPSPKLAMLDIPEFAYLKKVGELLDSLTAERPRAALSAREFQRLVSESKLLAHEAHVLRMHLKQQGINIQD